jgi:hypothetical protein
VSPPPDNLLKHLIRGACRVTRAKPAAAEWVTVLYPGTNSYRNVQAVTGYRNLLLPSLLAVVPTAYVASQSPAMALVIALGVMSRQCSVSGQADHPPRFGRSAPGVDGSSRANAAIVPEKTGVGCRWGEKTAAADISTCSHAHSPGFRGWWFTFREFQQTGCVLLIKFGGI